jgi:hypothetical protein
VAGVVRGVVLALPARSLLVSLVPHRRLALGWSRLGWHPARPGCRDLDLRSPLLTCRERYWTAPTPRSHLAVGDGCHTVCWVKSSGHIASEKPLGNRNRFGAPRGRPDRTAYRRCGQADLDRGPWSKESVMPEQIHPQPPAPRSEQVKVPYPPHRDDPGKRRVLAVLAAFLPHVDCGGQRWGRQGAPRV